MAGMARAIAALQARAVRQDRRIVVLIYLLLLGGAGVHPLLQTPYPVTYSSANCVSTQWDTGRMAVLESSPQASHSQWWRISPPSTNSDAIGATSTSSQCGQRTGEAKARVAKCFAQ